MHKAAERENIIRGWFPKMSSVFLLGKDGLVYYLSPSNQILQSLFQTKYDMLVFTAVEFYR